MEEPGNKYETTQQEAIRWPAALLIPAVWVKMKPPGFGSLDARPLDFAGSPR